MCSQSISGSSLLSGYNEDDVRERSGRSRREFEEIDAVLYDEEKSKRATIKKICEEWSSKPHFRIRGRLCQIEREERFILTSSTTYRSTDLNINPSTGSSSLDILSNETKDSAFASNEINTLLNDDTSGRSSIDSIEGSEITNNSDLDDNDDDERTNTPLNDQFTDASADSFDTDEDDDDNEDEDDEFSSGISNRRRTKHHRHHSHSKQPQMLIKCMKDSVVNSLASFLIRQFFAEQQVNLQRYTKFICERNAIKLRPKLRPYSLPPRSLSQNRFSLPTGSSITANGALVQLTQFPFRATPEPDMQLTGLLRVTPIRISNLAAITSGPTSPRKNPISSQNIAPVPTPPAPSLSVLPLTNPIERTSTASLVEKRNQQQISLIGTAVTNLPSQLAMIPSQTNSSQNPIRQSSSAWRYRSATATTTNTTTMPIHEPNTRLPPINIERISSNDQIPLNRSNTIIETMPPATRAVSGTSQGSSLSNTGKIRTLTSLTKLQKPSRPITISSISTTNKDLSHPSSTSPTRSMANTLTPSSNLRSTPATRTSSQHHQHQQKRPVVTTKAPPPAPASTVIKIPAPHIY